MEEDLRSLGYKQLALTCLQTWIQGAQKSKRKSSKNKNGLGSINQKQMIQKKTEGCDFNGKDLLWENDKNFNTVCLLIINKMYQRHKITHFSSIKD